MEEWPPTTQGGIYSPLSGGSETLLYLLRAPPLTHRSGGTHPPWGVGPPPVVGRAQFPHSYKQISTPPPPIPLITVATAMEETGGALRTGARLPLQRASVPRKQASRALHYLLTCLQARSVHAQERPCAPCMSDCWRLAPRLHQMFKPFFFLSRRSGAGSAWK